MASTAKHWIDPTFLAPNVVEVDVEPVLMEGLQPFVEEIQAGPLAPGDVTLQGLRFFHRTKRKWRSDVGWISAADERCYALFEDLFDRMGLAEKLAPRLNCDREVRLYSGFFVTRSHCTETDFHVDWLDGDNRGFTFLGAVSNNAGEIPMNYLTVRKEVREYRYPPGKGVVFGDRFLHSTGPGQTKLPTVLLCFNFGTDRMEDWGPLERTCASQSRLYRRPDGVFVEHEVPTGY